MPSARPEEEPRGAAGGLAESLRRRAMGWACEARRRIAIWQERRRMTVELESLDDGELAELGLARWQVPWLAQACPAAGLQLDQILARLRLRPQDGLELATYNSLYRTCLMCAKRRRCRNWLASAKGADGYPSFCPNAWAFHRLLVVRGAQPPLDP